MRTRGGVSGRRSGVAALLTVVVSMAGAADARAGRDSALWPFAVTSPWNTPIGSGAQYGTGSDSCSSDLTSTPGTPWINAKDFSIPVYRTAATDPTWTVMTRVYNPDPSAPPQYVADGQLQAPLGMKPAGPTAGSGKYTDAELSVVDASGGRVDEYYHVTAQYPLLLNDSHRSQSTTGSGLGSGIRAANISLLGGLIRHWELGAGSIRHALAFAIPRTHQRSGWVWPAMGEDGNQATMPLTGNVPTGQLAAIPASVDVTRLGLSPGGLVVAHALQDYGAYDVDSGDVFVFYAEPQDDASPVLAEMRGDMRRLTAALRCVTNNSAVNVGGGGTPRAAPAPGF